MKISYSAPGKLTFSGEHAVVYGKPALVASTTKRLHVTLWESNKKSTKDPGLTFISQKVLEYLVNKKIDYKNKLFDYQIRSDIAQNKGFGSSASLCVAATAAFLEFFAEKKFSKKVIQSVANTAEKQFHTNPSGMDTAAATFGGFILFRKTAENRMIIKRLKMKLRPQLQTNIFLIDSGSRAESTGQMVKQVAVILKTYPKKTWQIFESIEMSTTQMVTALMSGDKELFKKSIVQNQQMLSELRVVSKKSQQLLTDLSQFGVGKVTGAGGKKKGSGYILFFADAHKQLLTYLKKYAIAYIDFRQDFEGVRKENVV